MTTANVLPFVAVAVSTFVPGTSTLTVDEGYNAATYSALAQLADALQAGGTLLVSDVGYRTLPTDPGGPVAYPPFIDSAFQINRQMNLDPTATATAGAWGSINLSNAGNRYDSVVAVQNSDGRDAIVYYGEKTWNQTLQYYPDPAFASLSVAFHGIADMWLLTETELQIPIRDATYWLEKPLQTDLYDGSGTYGGAANLAGLPKPMTRGGTAAHPVNNVTPTLMDPVNQIYQYNNAAGTVQTLYEGGFATFTADGDTGNLYAGSVAPSHYRTDNSRGLFQLGGPPASGLPITADVTGQFPTGGVINLVIELAQWLIADDIQLPNTYFDATSFTAVDARVPYIAGCYFPTQANSVTGVQALDFILGSVGAKLVPLRNGRLGCVLLRAPSSPAIAASYTTANIVKVVPVALPANLSPPVYRARVVHQKNYTVMNSGISVSATDAQRAYIGTEGHVSAFVSAAALAAYRRPNDLPVIDSCLLVEADSLAVATALVALWGAQRYQYDVQIPQRLGILREFGDFVTIQYPIAGIASGTVGQFIGEQADSANSISTLRILV